LKQYPEAGLSFTREEVFDDQGPRPSTHNLSAWFKKHHIVQTEVAYGSIYSEMLAPSCMHTSSVVVRRDALDKVGFFDEEFKICQDYDLWLRFAQKYPVIAINRVLSRYRYRCDSLSGASDLRTIRWAQEILLVLEKHLHNSWIPAEFSRLAKSVMGQLCWEVGWNHFSRNQFKEARSVFFRGVRYDPFQAQLWIYGIFSFLPVVMVENIRRVKRIQAS
jgi:GT2 family glycosyltransferase